MYGKSRKVLVLMGIPFIISSLIVLVELAFFDKAAKGTKHFYSDWRIISIFDINNSRCRECNPSRRIPKPSLLCTRKCLALLLCLLDAYSTIRILTYGTGYNKGLYQLPWTATFRLFWSGQRLIEHPREGFCGIFRLVSIASQQHILCSCRLTSSLLLKHFLRIFGKWHRLSCWSRM